jgi:3-methyl-2-oxobutanoate hydroxymethyltransferase
MIGGTMARRTTIHDLRRMKQNGEIIPMITCYDYSSARIMDQAGVPIMLVGDTLGMVVLGHESTLRVTLDMMIHHASAVVRGSTKAMVVIDLPFGTYSASDLPLSLRTGKTAIAESGAQAVKVEGGRRMVPVVRTLVASGIPVMGHIGLTPQSIHMIGGFRVQGRGDDAAERLVQAALALEQGGIFALVLELVPAPLARRISEMLTIPTIGIGAGPYCDGQVQVFHDMMGLYPDFSPKHAKKYFQMDVEIRKAVENYLDEVRGRKFPGPEHSFDMEADD